MKKLLPSAGLVLFLCFASAPAQQDLDAITKALIKNLNETVKVLGGVKDKSTADEALPKLRDIAKTMQALKKKAEALKPSADEKEQMEKKYKPEIDGLLKKVLGEALRLSKVEGAEAVLKELESPLKK